MAGLKSANPLFRGLIVLSLSVRAVAGANGLLSPLAVFSDRPSVDRHKIQPLSHINVWMGFGQFESGLYCFSISCCHSRPNPFVRGRGQACHKRRQNREVTASLTLTSQIAAKLNLPAKQ